MSVDLLITDRAIHSSQEWNLGFISSNRALELLIFKSDAGAEAWLGTPYGLVGPNSVIQENGNCSGASEHETPDEAEKRGDTIKLPIEKGAVVNSQDRDGRAPLIEASKGGLAKIVKLLLEHGAEANIQDKLGWTAIMRATDRNHVSVIQALFSGGADLSLKNSEGKTALDLARTKGSSAEAYSLLKRLAEK